MDLQFHRAKFPARLYWAEWDDYIPGAEIVRQERVKLDADLSVHRFVPYIEKAVVGFYWEWGD